ncbi:hypothetical protein [Bacillus sp. JCM 19041]|uniref:hypothetical protein n=1 Tax=Bacillus sp. JCM 19041 TaxID=1460637 RepID=UPI0006D21380
MPRLTRLDQYAKRLWEKRSNKERKGESTNGFHRKKSRNFSSPVGEVPTEEVTITQQYHHAQNLLSISSSLPKQKKKFNAEEFSKAQTLPTS